MFKIGSKENDTVAFCFRFATDSQHFILDNYRIFKLSLSLLFISYNQHVMYVYNKKYKF